MKNLFYLIILTVLFVTSAMAQVINEGTNPVYVTKFNLAGVQSAEGSVDKVNNMRLGNTFVLNGTEENLSYHLTMAMDYIVADPDIYTGNQIVSGTWSITVYKSDVYFGVMYGDISGGGIRWAVDSTAQVSPQTGQIISRQTDAQLTITGGLDGYADQEPQVLEDVLSATTYFSPSGPPVTEATVHLPLSSR